MLKTVSTTNYNRADMAAILSALPREEQQWTWDFLNKIIVLSTQPSKQPSYFYSTPDSVTPIIRNRNERSASIDRLCGALQDDGVPYEVTKREIMEERYGKI